MVKLTVKCLVVVPVTSCCGCFSPNVGLTSSSSICRNWVLFLFLILWLPQKKKSTLPSVSWPQVRLDGRSRLGLRLKETAAIGAILQYMRFLLSRSMVLFSYRLLACRTFGATCPVATNAFKASADSLEEAYCRYDTRCPVWCSVSKVDLLSLQHLFDTFWLLF